ncbi:MAG: hypothetical protein AB8B99_21050 [Phormidesmis sp.]
MNKQSFARRANLSIGLGALSWVGISAPGLSSAQANEVPSLDRLLNRTPAQEIPVQDEPTSAESGQREDGLTIENGLPIEDLPTAGDGETVPTPPSEAAIALQQAEVMAQQAEVMAQRARSAADWDAVMAQWLEAISLVQSVPPESPSRIVAQRQMRAYLQRLLEVQQRTEQASPVSGLPSLGSHVFDSQLSGYLSYVATVGTPDILIVGSSRALQGIDPRVLQQNLARQGHGDLRVFNFSVNGATAQVVDFVLRELLPEPLPSVIVWGDGSRAFNDGRRDRTWEGLVASPGYRAVTGGVLPSEMFLRANVRATANIVTARSPLPEIPGNLDAFGFSAVGDQFSPQTYYQQFPRVNGRYDGAYSPFTLYGPQTAALENLAAAVNQQNSQLIFVNLPLSDSYLDDYRLYYEEQFQQFLQAQGITLGFDVVDFLTLWQGQPALFADPSHINKDGAAAIAVQLSQHPKLLAALSAPALTHEPKASDLN